MIYDHIKNIGLYKGLSVALDTALDFIAGAKLPMENGTTMLEHGVKAIVSEYVTKEENPKGYEAHIRYADVQFLMDGSEYIRCCPLEFLDPSTDYDETGDCRFYVEQPGSGCALRLGAGYFAVVFPDDAHIPQLAIGAPAPVKKIVLKVPMD